MIVHRQSVPAAVAHLARLLALASALAACETTPTELAAPAASASFSSVSTAVDPATLTPNPVEFSGPGTVWECRRTGDEVQCTGHFTQVLDGEENGIECEGRPIIIVDGEFARDQVRYFNADLLEVRRNGHLTLFESWSLSPDGSGPGIEATQHQLQSIEFEIPGDLDSRRPTEIGSDVLIKVSNGMVLAQFAGRSTTTGPVEPEIEPNTFKGRWDAGGEALDAKFCAVLQGS